MIDNQKMQEEFVATIKEIVPERGRLTALLIDILGIKKEAVYRRLRGEVPFIFSEIAKISKALNVSLDSFIGISMANARPFQLRMIDFLNSEKPDYDTMEMFANALIHLKDCPGSEVASALNLLPQSITMDYELIYRFYLCKWLYEYKSNESVKNYSEVHQTDRMKQINKKIVTGLRGADKTFFICNENLYEYLVNDIKYFQTINLITAEEVKALKEEIMHLLDDMEEIVARGQFASGKKVYLYISGIHFESSCSYIQSTDYILTLIKIFTLNDVVSHDIPTLNRVKSWMQSVKRTSTMISESGEIERIRFFDKQRQFVKTL